VPARRLIRWSSQTAPLAAVAAALFVAALDTYVVVTLLPRMLTDLNIPFDRIEKASPIITGFLLGYIVTMPLLGAVSDVRGRGPVFALSVMVFAAGSTLTATAGMSGFPNEDFAGLPWLVAGRVLQGLGGGAMVPVALALAADVYPTGARAMPLGTIAALQESGSVIGPLYGAGLAGAAAGFGAWRAVFWINLPLMALCLAGFMWARSRRRYRVPSGHPSAPPPAGRGGLHRRRSPTMEGAGGGPIDWVGGALLGAGLALLVLALYPDDPSRRAVGAAFVPLFAGAVIVLAMYVLRQALGRDPLVPPQLLRNRVFVGANLTNLLVGAGLMVALVDVPILARAVYGLDEIGGALLLARFMLAIPIGALAGGWLSNPLGYRLTAVAGLLLAAFAFFVMSNWGAQELSRRLVGPITYPDVTLGLCGLGFGLVIAPVAAAILDRAREREHGLASSLVVLARTTGMLLGLSVLTAVGLHRFFELMQSGPQIALRPGSSNFAQQAAALQQKVQGALLAEYHEIFSLAAIVLLVAMLVAFASLRGGRVQQSV